MMPNEETMSLQELADRAGVAKSTAVKHLNRCGIRLGYTEKHLERIKKSIAEAKPGRPWPAKTETDASDDEHE